MRGGILRGFGARFLNGSAIFTLQVISIFYLGSVTGWLDVTHTEYTFSSLLYLKLGLYMWEGFFICGFKKQGTCECLNGINGVNRMQIIFSQGQGPKSCVSQDNQLELSQWRLTYPRPVGGALLHHGTST